MTRISKAMRRTLDNLRTASDTLATKFESSLADYFRFTSVTDSYRAKAFNESSVDSKNTTDVIKTTAPTVNPDISKLGEKEFVFDPLPQKVRATDLESTLKKLGRLPAYLYLEYVNGIVNHALPVGKESRKWRSTGVLGILSTDKLRFLIKSLKAARSETALFTRLSDLHSHLMENPCDRSKALREGCIPILLYLKCKRKEKNITLKINEVLASLGFVMPVKGNGINILSIDGGGTRGIMGLQILKYIEAELNQPLHQVFDYICGVSTGAIIAMIIGVGRKSATECEDVYNELSKKVFSQNTIVGASSLLWSHSYYNTDSWVDILQNYIGDKPLLETARIEGCPKISCVSTVINTSRLKPYIFRNYNMPFKRQSQYLGSSMHKCWEAVRASAAAPGYFKEFCIGDYVHQDGGVLTNNPTGIAIHEARILWPNIPIQCVMSLGNGRYEPVGNNFTGAASWKTKFQKLVDGATDTEEVHIIMNDLVPGNVYFRFNPYLSENIYLDENRPEKLSSLRADAQLYIRKNQAKLEAAVKAVSKKKSLSSRIADEISLKTDIIRGLVY